MAYPHLIAKARADFANPLTSNAYRYNLPEPWQEGSRSSRLRTPDLVVSEVSSAVANTNRIGRLEAVLWLATEPLALRRLSRAAGLTGVGEVRELLEELSRRLTRRGSGLEVVEVAGGVRLLTRSVLAPWLDKVEPRPEEHRMSVPALETLAIVAYRQPVVRSEIEAIRGVGCGELLRQLLEADLLRIVGRSEELGKPLLYGTTDRFLELFGLRSLDGLPQPDEGAAGARPKEQNAPAWPVLTESPPAA